MDVQVFYCEPTGQVRGWLRRYASGAPCQHPGNHGYHDAHALVFAEAPELFEADDDERDVFKHFPKNDKRWPTHCACGYKFDEHHAWQYATRKIYRRLDNGQTFVMRDLDGDPTPLGAMWDANWYGEGPGLNRRVGPDGLALQVRIPHGQTWTPDARASNCTSPCKHCKVEYQFHKIDTCSNPGDGVRAWTKGQYEDAVPGHYCWVRHGDARSGQVHVDKAGITCRAGAGSILYRGDPSRGIPEYHGFLHHGKLTACP